MLEEGEKNPTDEMSQMMIDGISIPENSTLINTKVTKDLNTRENNGSTLQQMNAFGVSNEMASDHPYD